MSSDNRNDATYLAWLAHIVNTHQTLAWDLPRTPELEAEEDRLNETWDDLNEVQRQRIWGLSADLNSLRDNEVAIASDWPPSTEGALKAALDKALNTENWDRALDVLRRPQLTLARHERDALRARCWNGLGHPEIAGLFADNAHRIANDMMAVNQSVASAGPIFKTGDSVLLRSTLELGVVEKEPQLVGGEYWYRVRFVKRREDVVEDDLETLGDSEDTLESLASGGRWGRLQAVRCALGLERILNTNRSTIYAFQSQRILFEPYQYKPLLKVLDSPDRRVLIADEVGLGKTIEAGLVLTELSARRPMERVLVVCPSRLREKWRNELNGKFDQDFDILDKRSFLQAASRAQENASRFRLRGIISMQSMRGDEVRESLTSELGQVDMVIVDEAHHARNRKTATSEMLRELCEVGDCVLLLTATPLHLKSEDLFTLVNALRPSEFRDAFVFDRQLERYAAVHVASTLARTQQADRLDNVDRLLTGVFTSNGYRAQPDPKAIQVLNEIRTSPPSSRREWVELERQIQDLHPLGSVVTRTRKRDVIENAPVRRARTCHCDWTLEEDAAYQKLVGTTGPLGWLRKGLSLGQIQRARQAASCLPAAFESRAVETKDDDAVELTDILPSEVTASVERAVATRSVIDWEGTDSKLRRLKQILRDIRNEEDDAKVLIFTYFRGTARYLEKNLSEPGRLALRIDGDVVSDPRRPAIDERGDRIRRFQYDPAVKILVSTEVGSEGLDFQFCHHLINYDLPWNPMVVEQRIGRIDRFGQESDVVHIHNLVVRGTVEDSILERLYTRIGIFERSIGNLEAILGETISELQRDFVSGNLTPEEAEHRVELAANAINRKSTHLEDLEKQASELFGHEEYIRDEMSRVRNLGRYISEESILALLRTYFESHHPKVKLKREAKSVYGFRITDELRHEIQDATRGGAIWIDRSREGVLLFTTAGDMAFRRKELDLVNASHPLVKAAVKKVQPQLDVPSARLGQAMLRRIEGKADAFQPGLYFFVIFAHTITSIRSRRILETVAWDDRGNTLLESEDGERLMYLTIEHGMEWHDQRAAPPIAKSVWTAMTDEARKRNREIFASEQRENGALYVRRRNALQAEHDHDLTIKERRLQTAQARGKSRILPAMQGQIEKARAEFRMKLEELNQLQEATASLSEPLAACAVLLT